jgi:hypothetical protein
LFISILSAASCGHPLQDNAGPRGALTCRLAMFIVGDGPDLRSFARADEARREGSNLKTYERVVNLKLKNFLLDFHLTRSFE